MVPENKLNAVQEGYNPPTACDSEAGPMCYQIQEWISCCGECKEDLDLMADCMLGTGRAIDSKECDILCTGPLSGALGIWRRFYVGVILSVMVGMSLY